MKNDIKHVHDPCIMQQGRYYYIFSTGHGIPIRRSTDLIQWESVGRVFKEDVPAWAKEAIPGTVFPWAPDIAHLNGRYYLYYSISTFGKNRSAIGLATNKTLDPKSKDYEWQDEGKVFESFPNNDYNAIDSNVIAVGRNRLVFTFGSFWTGIKLVEADHKTGKPKPGAEVRSLVRRPPPCAVEAPFVIKQGSYFYMFASYDTCCRGIRSTYNVKVGRAKTVEGPYVDRNGVSLLEDGGTQVVKTEGRYIGPGHCSVLKKGGQHFLVHHFYDAEDNGVPTLQIRPMTWDKDGWPVAGSPLG